MPHLVHRVKSFQITGPYTLRVCFDDTCQKIDFAPVLEGEMYGPLRELALFNVDAGRTEVT